jgi:hypothetical protein
MESAVREKLLYRRQYLYGPRVDEFPQWRHINLVNGCHLAVHPDLEVTEYKSKPCSLVLLGYLLDPEAPAKLNADILKDLASIGGTTEQITNALDGYGGRYVLFIFNGGDQIVVNDAGGLRQVFYHRAADGGLWLAPQPGLISQKFGLKYSQEAQDFLNSEVIQKNKELWWPGTSSPFKEILHLLPNHQLDLKTGAVKRYWPRERIKKYSVTEGAKIGSRILRGLMKAANNRFDLAMAMTAGYDSRIVFAASKEILKDLYGYTMIYHKLTPTSSDVVWAAKLAEFVGIQHHLFACDKPMTDEFEYLYTHNLEKSYQSYGNIVFGRFQNLDQKKVVVKSVVNEIARCFYYRTGVYPFNVGPDLLCAVSKLGAHPFARRNFSEWMDDAKPAQENGYKILDLFYWENRNANWQAMSQLEFDLAQEEFTPFAHRTLLATMLGVDHKHRCMPKNVFQREMVRASWPELDTLPYNPTSKIIRKPFYEGPWMTAARWIKYRFLRKR